MGSKSKWRGEGDEEHFRKGKKRKNWKGRKGTALDFKPFSDLGKGLSFSGEEPGTSDDAELALEDLLRQLAPPPPRKSDRSSGRPIVRRGRKVITQKKKEKPSATQRSFGAREARVNIYLNPFEYPKSLPIQIFIKGQRDHYFERQISRLMPLPYDLVAAEGSQFRVVERRQDKAVVYVDHDGSPVKIYGNIPYAISFDGGRMPDLEGSFWAVHLPLSQDAAHGSFRLMLEEAFEDDSVIGREVEMAKYQWDLPAATPESDPAEVEAYRAAFREAVRLERLIDVQDVRLMENLHEDAERYDLRHRLIYTIDSEETQDIDDAIEVVRLSDKSFLLGIHIADVTEFVKEGSNRDKDARDRATSHYLADRVIHMLPECLSQEYCSLRENRDRLAISAYAEIEGTDGGYEIKGTRFCRSLIQSRAKLTYRQVEGILNGNPSGVASDIVESLRHARDLAALIESHSPYHDMSFSSGNVKYREDDEGRVLRKDEALGISDMLIEMFMITANRLVGQKIADLLISTSAEPRGIGVYRVQQTPNEEDLRHFVGKLQQAQLIPSDLRYEGVRDHAEKALERRLAAGERLSRRERETLLCGEVYKRILHHMDKTNPAVRMKWNVLERYAHKPGRLRAKAGLSDSHRTSHHLSLGISRYPWFTSPIRRYPDMVNHRQLKTILSAKPPRPSEANVGALARRINNGDKAEQALSRRLLLYHLCDQKALLERESVAVTASSFQWVMSQDWAIEVQGIWNDLYPRFVFCGRRGQQLPDIGQWPRLLPVERVDPGGGGIHHHPPGAGPRRPGPCQRQHRHPHEPD